MDGRQFDALLLSLTESRRFLLKGTLAAAAAWAGRASTEAKKNKNKKRKGKGKKKRQDDGGCPEGQVASETFCIPIPDTCPGPNQVQCPGQIPGNCCPESDPVCGPHYDDINAHKCCPHSRQVCPRDPRNPVGSCCPLYEYRCCPPALDRTIRCCGVHLNCSEGREDGDRSGACCQFFPCKSTDDCPNERHVCSDAGCCVPGVICELPNRTRDSLAVDEDCCAKNGESCEVDQDCCEDEDRCDGGICKRKHREFCEDGIICEDAYPFCAGERCLRCQLPEIETGTADVCCPPTKSCPAANGGAGACCVNEQCCLPHPSGLCMETEHGTPSC